jgi:hypothetical protein
MRFGRARRGLALVFLVGLGVAACSGSSATSIRDAALDGRPVDYSDGHSDGRSSELGLVQPDSSNAALPSPCGGTVQTTGTTPSGSFSAQYVFASYATCGDVLLVDIAESGSNDSDLIRILLSRNSQTSSFLGATTTANVTYVNPGGTGTEESLPAEVNITSFPPTISGDQDGGLDPVTGSFSIDTGGFSITGSFSSPLCAVVACG